MMEQAVEHGTHGGDIAEPLPVPQKPQPSRPLTI